MKYLNKLTATIFTILILSPGIALAGVDDIPKDVRDAFNKMYPMANDMDWERDREGDMVMYEVEFELDEKEMEACFNEAGKWMKTEEEIERMENLPFEVVGTIERDYEDYRFDEAKKVVYDEKDTRYKVELEKGLFREKELVFDKAGTVMHKHKHHKKHKKNKDW